MNSTDSLRGYTAPRAVLKGLLFLASVLFRVPAVVLAIGVQVLDRCADRLLTWVNAIPPAPIRAATAPSYRRYAR